VAVFPDDGLSWQYPHRINVRFGPLCGLKSESRSPRSAITAREQLQQTARLFDNLVGSGEKRRRHF
jgi:hypothetical protein